MDTNSTIAQNIYYDHTNIDNKHYFGGYLNLAYNNWEDVIKEYNYRFERVNLKEGKTFEAKFTIDNFKNLTYQDYQNRVDFLKRHFPVVHYLEKLSLIEQEKKDPSRAELEKREYFIKSFKALYKTIHDLRNFYTHHYHDTLVIKDFFYQLLDSLLFSVIEDVKRLKKKDGKTKQILKVHLQSELDKLKAEKTEWLKKEQAKGEKVSLDDASITITNSVFNDAFKHFIYKEKDKKEKLSFHYQSKFSSEVSTENKINITQNALLFLLGMFLNKREGEDLRSKIKGHKAKIIKTNEEIDRKNNSLRLMATHWVFGYLSFKGVKNKIQTQFTNETLLMQIADELSKVPDVVYQTFTQEQKDLFVTDINEFIKEGKQDYAQQESRVIHPVIRKRYEDKFNYFALRYLDEFANFPTLRFQLHLGNYIHDKREKTIQGTEFKTECFVKEKIKTFAKLSEATNFKNDFFTKYEKVEAWEVFPNPSYNIVNNNIPIYFIECDKKEEVNFKNLRNKLLGQFKANREEYRKKNRESEYKLRSSKKTSIATILSEMNTYSWVNEAPTALLSLNELPALLYDLLIRKKQAIEIEKTLLEKLENRFQTIQNYEAASPLSNSQIARRLNKPTNEVQTNVIKLIRAIEGEVQLTKDKLQLIEDHRKEVKDKKRKYILTTRELGVEATWLANDLKRFMPKEIRAQWKGYQHSFLQKSLSFYNHQPREAFDYLRQYWDLKKEKNLYDNWINQAFRTSTFDQLLGKYLSGRLEFFKTINTQLLGFSKNKKQLNRFLVQHNIWTIFNKRTYTISETEILKQRLLVKPLVFPRGIFDEKPTYIKGESIEEDPDLYADWYQYVCGYTDYQYFYKMEGGYKELYQAYSVDSVGKNKYELTEDQRQELFQRKYEKHIKKSRIQDVYLQLIAQDLTDKVLGVKEDISLKNFYLPKDVWIEVADEQYRKITSIWDYSMPFEKGQIKAESIRLKDIGKFKNLTADDKVKRIQSYDKQRVWDLQALEDELYLSPTSYEVIRRDKLLKSIQEFEKAILPSTVFENSSHPVDFEVKGNPNFKKYITEGVLRKIDAVSTVDIEWLNSLNEFAFESMDTLSVLEKKSVLVQKAFLIIYIRNKFAHNQLLTPDLYNFMCRFLENNMDKLTYSFKINTFVEQTIEEFKPFL